MTQPTVFISYSRNDEAEKDRLLAHLGVLESANLIDLWSDDQIQVGVDWEEEINQAMARASVAILLISGNFLTSEFIIRQEIPRLLQRRSNEGLIVFPVIIKACAWKKVDWLAKMSVRPRNRRPVWSDGGSHADEDLSAIAAEIANIIERKSDDYTSEFAPNRKKRPLSELADDHSQKPPQEVVPPSQKQPIAEPTPEITPPIESTAAISSLIRELRVANSAITATAASDRAIQNRLEDKLGFGVYAEALRDFIASEDTATPLTIGIDAPWGHGKTSLMRMIQNELNPRRSWTLRVQAWLRLQRWRIVWLLATPVWYTGKLIIWLGKGKSHQLLTNIIQGMARPEQIQGETDANQVEQTIPKMERFFGWLAQTRQPLEAQHPTIWFNAWKFDQEESIWAALAISILEQIKAQHSWLGRLAFWLGLSVRRFNHLRAWQDVISKIFWPLLLGGLGWLWAQGSGQIDFLPPVGQNLVQWALWGGAILTMGMQLASIIKDPFSLSFRDYVSETPDYQEKIGFLGEFEEDFNHIVQMATRRIWGWKPRKLVIFIDDLDRCEPPKPVDIIEAINIFLDSSGCIFIIGMDARAIVASIETKYKDLFEKFQQDSPSQPRLGRYFLEKIIQIPFTIPPIPDHLLSSLVINIIGPNPDIMGLSPRDIDASDDTEQEPEYIAGAARREDVGSYQNSDVWRAIHTGTKYLEANPRQLKRFINLFRLQLYIANARGLFCELTDDDQSENGYTLNCLAAWIALSMRWPQVTFYLNQEHQQSELRQWLLWIAQLVVMDEEHSRIVESDSNIEDQLHPELVELLKSAKKQKDTPQDTLLMQLDAKKKNWQSLSWDQWLNNSDFLRVTKVLENWWVKPSEEQRDWLTTALMFQERVG